MLPSAGLSKLVQVEPTLPSLANPGPAEGSHSCTDFISRILCLLLECGKNPKGSTLFCHSPPLSVTPAPFVLTAPGFGKELSQCAHTHTLSPGHCVFSSSAGYPQTCEIQKQSPIPAVRTLWMHVLQQLQGHEGQGQRGTRTR